MAVLAIVPTSELEFSNRIDAELYQPSLRQSFEKIFQTGLPVTRLRRVCVIRSGTTPQDRIDGLTAGPILFKTTDIRNGIVPLKGDYYRITDGIHRRMAKTRLEDRDVLLNIVGATLDVIGRSAFICRLRDDANITQAMVFLRCQTPDVLPGFLFAYLNTRYGQDQIARYARPTGQYNLNLQEVGHICIPLLSIHEQQTIEQLILAAGDLQDASMAGYSEAQQYLESALGLDKLTFQKPVSYTVRFNQLENSRRFDPEHYYPAFSAFKDSLPKGIVLSPLSNHLTFCQRGKQPDYSISGLPVINSKHVKLSRVVLEDNRLAFANQDATLRIRYGDTLLNGTGRGTLGRAAPYLIDQAAIPDNHVTILRSVNLDPVFLSLYLNSAAGQMQVEMHQRGTSGQLELYPSDIRRFLIWPAPEAFQLQLREIYDRASAAERESRELLETAKARVEQLINEAGQP